MVADDFIVFKNIHKSFDRQRVLRDVNLKVSRGETLVIFGGSGTGKTVLVSMLVGLNVPDQGEIWLDGQEITKFKKEKDWHSVRLKVGYLFQGSALFDSMSARENLAFPLKHHTSLSPSQIDARVKELLSLVRLEGIHNQFPSELSGGMQRRLALARTLALTPQVVIYDEPSSALDPINADAIAHLIRDLQHTLGVTSLVVTHDMPLAFTLADKMSMMHHGHILAYGTVEEIKQNPNPLVQQMLSGNSLKNQR
jgi:phospholipid/cholesterol/gamma-HCH transport system ATP-binding protein